MVREREGDRLLPWSEGEPGSSPATNCSYSGLFGGIRAVLLSRISLVVITIMFLDGLIGGYGSVLTPLAAINLFGFTTPEWSNLVATMGLLGAVAAFGLGPLIDRFGAKRMQSFSSWWWLHIHSFWRPPNTIGSTPFTCE
jgi:MFS transporter, PAT family, beta-lactamase induction signal transducer AmpG